MAFPLPFHCCQPQASLCPPCPAASQDRQPSSPDSIFHHHVPLWDRELPHLRSSIHNIHCIEAAALQPWGQQPLLQDTGFSSLRFTAPWTEREQRKELSLQPGTSRNSVLGESLPVLQPTRLFESHRGASTGSAAPTCSCCLPSAASTPGCRHTQTWAPAPKARDSWAARGKGKELSVGTAASLGLFFF